MTGIDYSLQNDRIVEDIQKVCSCVGEDIANIVPFGSSESGFAGLDSDIDILVMSKKSPRETLKRIQGKCSKTKEGVKQRREDTKSNLNCRVC